jgi:alpha-N-arabinofuranosidase
MKTIIIIFFFILASSYLSAENFNAKISIDTNFKAPGIVTNKLFGGFTEFLVDYINGPNGIWAQEFMDRGFDESNASRETSKFWEKFTRYEPKCSFQLKSGGYNENGSFYQSVSLLENGKDAGIYQKITNNDTVGFNFYCYVRGNTSNKRFRISVYDTTLERILYYQNLTLKDTINWNKYSIYIPPIKNHTKVKILISIINLGNIDIDEASIMPENNIHGIRKEYFDLFKNWNMGTLRYPGGCFADFVATKWYNGIGDIDKRKPMPGDGNYFQRMDLGIHEVMWLCDTLKISPYFTINFSFGTIKEASEWIQYCNYDTNNMFGNIRYKNGSFKPFNVKYWEIGNEQWFYGLIYPIGYVPFYDSLVKIDPEIKFILATDVWPGKPYFDTTMSIIGKKGNIYSFHPLLTSIPEEYVTDSEWFLNTVSLPNNFESYITNLESWLIEAGLDTQYMQGSNEWALGYTNFPDLLFDRNEKSATLEAGIYYAGVLHTYIRNARTVHMSNVTIGYGFIRRGFNKNTGQRAIVGAPSYQAVAMISSHFGETPLKITLDCPTYAVPEKKGFWLSNHKYLDVVATKSIDSIFISVINKSFSDSAVTILDLSGFNDQRDFAVYQLSSDHFLDANTFEEPNKILPQKFIKNLSSTFVFPKHSLTILAIPIKAALIYKDTAKVEISVYPIPSENSLNIENLNSDLLKIEFFDVTGKMFNLPIISESKEKVVVDISRIQSGKYFIKLFWKNQVITKDFIKNQ